MIALNRLVCVLVFTIICGQAQGLVIGLEAATGYQNGTLSSALNFELTLNFYGFLGALELRVTPGYTFYFQGAYGSSGLPFTVPLLAGAGYQFWFGKENGGFNDFLEPFIVAGGDPVTSFSSVILEAGVILKLNYFCLKVVAGDWLTTGTTGQYYIRVSIGYAQEVYRDKNAEREYDRSSDEENNGGKNGDDIWDEYPEFY